MKEKNKTYKILLVDDDKFLLDMYSTKFNEKGFDVTAVFGGAEAILKLEEGFTPEIILTDIVMPAMDGFEFITEINNKKLVPNASIIILSNLGQKEDFDKGAELGVDGYIVKATSTPTEVVNEVLKIVESK